MKKNAQRPLRVVQVSDSHLFASTEGRLLGLNTEDSLRLVLEKVQREQTHIDLILATGDIAQDASEAAYTRFQQHLAQFDAPNYWLQGNHDITEPILNTLNDKTRLSPCVIQQDGWQIIMLNSSVEYEVPGNFAPNCGNFITANKFTFHTFNKLNGGLALFNGQFFVAIDLKLFVQFVVHRLVNYTVAFADCLNSTTDG